MTAESVDFNEVCEESKKLVHLTAEGEALIRQIEPKIIPHLDRVTNRFYEVLQDVPSTAALLEGRVEHLKKTHRQWLESLFTQEIDAKYTQWMHHIGEVHVKVKLPVEFMTSGMALIQQELLEVLAKESSLDAETRLAASKAMIALCGFSQLVMQKSYSEDTLRGELERFLTITGMSRALFNNLAAAF
ncbi:hypothetical protein HX099_07440 [Thiopseudomonas alkaliphila]|uniref:Globin-sensor domain-containing protein n=1 Tax=Thiopseudomonas alkaliphila TaxID=1697053 RepID=A0AAW7DU20_9GAMM|nr:protoglobin domain-containing protein [Thiopseudomonas alkaliphila]MDM1696493.1 hypothetical protein [Thiopseudomonas alkaliphila]